APVLRRRAQREDRQSPPHRNGPRPFRKRASEPRATASRRTRGMHTPVRVGVGSEVLVTSVPDAVTARRYLLGAASDEEIAAIEQTYFGPGEALDALETAEE